MKQHLKFIVFAFFLGSLSNYSQEIIDTTRVVEIDWPVFEDKEAGYSIQYPGGWIPTGRKGGFICGRREGFKNAEWTLWFTSPKNSDSIDFIFNETGLYEGYERVEEQITIGEIEGVHTVLTHIDFPKKYIEFVILKTEEMWYKIENAGIQDESFKYFYQSFKILDK